MDFKNCILEWKTEIRISKASEKTSKWAADFKNVIHSYFAYKIRNFVFSAVQLKINILY